MTEPKTDAPVRREDVTDEDLQVLTYVRAIVAAETRASYSKVLQALVREGIAVTEPASVAQAQQQATIRNKLLATPCYSYKTLALVRNENANATRTTVGRWVRAARAFTVGVNGRTVIPAFQLTDDGQPREDLAPLLKPLTEAGLGSWQMWAWMTQPAGLLSGLVPAEAAANPETCARAAHAAERLAARTTPASPAA
jgi:hypothetical protein